MKDAPTLTSTLFETLDEKDRRGFPRCVLCRGCRLLVMSFVLPFAESFAFRVLFGFNLSC